MDECVYDDFLVGALGFVLGCMVCTIIAVVFLTLTSPAKNGESNKDAPDA